MIELVIHEGRKHIVRRLLEEVGHPVLRLLRTAVGEVQLGNQRPGRFRRLSHAEIGALYRSSGSVSDGTGERRRGGAFGRSGARSRSTPTPARTCWKARPSWSRRCWSATSLSADDIISILFTATPDLTAEFPAYAARLLGLTDVPLMCASEIAVPGAMPRVLRLLAHVETDLGRADVRHVYLRGAAALRSDLPR